MLRTIASLLLCSSLAPLPAQTCQDNVHAIHFVNAQGVPLPATSYGGMPFAQSEDEHVYMALGPTFPSGIYYVQLTDWTLMHVLAGTYQLDRIFVVTNNGGVIGIQRMSGAAGLPAMGLGLGGVGQSIPLFPMNTPDPALSPPCRWKAWIGDCYDPNWDPTAQPYGSPFGIRGVNPVTGQCCVRSYAFFQVGDGSGQTMVSGKVFHDENHDGVRNGGEGPLVGWEVRLVTPTSSIVTTTDTNGCYFFHNVGAGNYSVELVVQSGWTATTPTSRAVEVCGCAPSEVLDFGAYMQSTCNGHTPGFWSNRNGRALIDQHNLLALLPSLHLVDAAGNPFATLSYSEFRSWLSGGNAVNMAYQLSRQLVAMVFNRAVGFVNGSCTVNDPVLGVVTIDVLIQRAIDSLTAYPLTPSGHPQRAAQEALKNALDDANNNRNWL
jgi:hypothetical protein